jgi:TRAP-type mannitol/chloroaromatic compound transport system permease large subunit
MAVTLMVSVLVSCSIFQLRRWYNAAKTNAPAAPTAADSVGVAMPEKSWKMLQETSTETIKVTAMVFAILVGATAFSMVFTYRIMIKGMTPL